MIGVVIGLFRNGEVFDVGTKKASDTIADNLPVSYADKLHHHEYQRPKHLRRGVDHQLNNDDVD